MRKTTQKVIAGLSALALLGSMAACSSDKKDEEKGTASSSQSEETSDSTSESEEGSSDGDSDAEPKEIVLEHAYGTSTFMYKPDRPIAVRNGVDALLAMGITPVAFVGIESEPKQPWRAELLKDVEFIPFDDAALEKVLAVKPNLVIADQWVIGQQFYDMVSPYAPVVAPKNKEIGEGNDWKYRIRAIGKIYGEEEKAEQLIADYDQMIADTKEKLPNLEGKTVLSVDIDPGQGAFSVVVDPDDPSYYLFRDLGMNVPQKVQEDLLGDADSGRVKLSYEDVSYLDADYLLLGAYVNSVEEGKQLIDTIPGLVDLPGFKEGRVQLDEAGANNQAMSKPTALNRKWLLDYVMPYLEKIGK